MRIARLFVVVAATALMVGACSGAASTAAPTAAPTAAATAAASSGGGGAATVSIKGFKFNPDAATAAVGGTVNWTNDDTTAHTVTFDDASVKGSGNIDAAGKFAATFAKAGAFTYHCAIHPTMKGTITVS